MAAPSPQAFADGITTILKGCNSGVSPRLLASDQLAWGVNITNRNALPRTRPVWRKVALVYEDADQQALATEKLFQGASFHQGYGPSESVLLASIGGHLFRYQVGTNNAVTDVSLLTDLNSSVAPQAWLWQSEDFTIVQNGLANPLFFDGAGTRRSLGMSGGELPAGTVGVYVQGRNWTALQDRQSYIAGDLVYSHGFTGPYNGRDAVLKTEENTFFSGGGAFAVPVTAGYINAMSSVAIPDTSLGQGPLLVTTSNSIFSIQVPLDRTQWAITEYPIITIGLPSYGPLAQWSTVVINGDVWYRAQDGIRSYTVARRDFNTWVNTPLSVEMSRVLDYDTQELLGYSSGVFFDNRLLTTCSPKTNVCRGVYHQGLVALDFNNISNLTTRVPPSYDGLWTGLNILRILKGTFNGVERCFAFALDNCTRICLYELLKDSSGFFDYDGENDVAIASSIESRSMLGPDHGNMLKRLKTADLFLDKLAGPGDGEVACALSYRSDEHPLWTAWHSWEMCAKINQCDFVACAVPQNLWPAYRTFVRMPEPADACNVITGRQMRTGYEFQVKLAWTGYAQLNRLLVWMTPAPESVATACPTTETCRTVAGCLDDLFTYEIESSECDDPAPDCNADAIPTPEPEPEPESPSTPAPEPPPEYPAEPPGWPPAPPPPPLISDEGWPPPVPNDPLEPPLPPAPPTSPPSLSCAGSQVDGWQWYASNGTNSLAVRNDGALQTDDPNTVYDAALISWWKAHLQAAFLSELLTLGTPINSYAFVWVWDTSGTGWNAHYLRDFDGYLPLASPGWALSISYCTTP